jgi:hypothetical protein
MTQGRGSDWRTILLATGSAGGALLAFSGVVFLLVFGSLDNAPTTLVGARRSTLDLVVSASALVVVGAALLLALYYSLVRLGGRAVPASNPRTLRVSQVLGLIVIWLAAAVGAGLLVDKPVVKWITPLLYVLAIGLPAYFFARLATGGLHPGSRQRTWGAFAAGIELGITPAIVAEVLLALIAVAGIAVYLSFQPDQLAVFRQLARELENSGGPQDALSIVGPWLTSPIALVLALLFFSGFAPLIEETAKSLAVWSLFDRLASPAQGFAIGAISGTAFGLVESLLVSATPDPGWTPTLLVRGVSTMMHIMAASLTGLGIAQFRSTRRFTWLLGLYLAAFFLHGAWNASVVAITFGSLRSAAVSSGPDVIGIVLILLGGAVLLVLCLSIPVGMWGINWRLRALAEAASASPQEGISAVTTPRKDDDTETGSKTADTPSPPAPPS